MNSAVQMRDDHGMAVEYREGEMDVYQMFGDLNFDNLLRPRRADLESRRRERRRGWMLVLLAVLLIAALFLWGETARSEPVPGGDSLVDRMAAGILKWKTEAAGGNWFSCGAVQPDAHGLADKWATEIVSQATTAEINPWGMAGVIANESGFDHCAIGKHSRDFGRKLGILRPTGRTISHTREDVLGLLADSRWRKQIGIVDLGPCQLVYPTTWKTPPAPLLTIVPGVQYCMKEMVYRRDRIGAFSDRARTRPWGTWPGYYAEGYDLRIVRYARALGATTTDLSDPE